MTEAVSNVVRHAYGAEECGEFDLEVELDCDVIVVRVEDRGSGRHAGHSDDPGSGLGVSLIHALADASIERTDGAGTRVVLRFRQPVDSTAGAGRGQASA